MSTRQSRGACTAEADAEGRAGHPDKPREPLACGHVNGPVVSVRGLVKSYGDFQAVRGIDLEVHAGEVFAFLGPNGAGKTTTTEILEGYRDRSAGEVSVLGTDPARPSREWRSRSGIVLQASGPDRYLTVRETVSEYADFYPSPRPVDETIDQVGLTE